MNKTIALISVSGIAAAAILAVLVFDSPKNEGVQNGSSVNNVKTKQKTVTPTGDGRTADDRPKTTGRPIDETGIIYSEYSGPKADVASHINVGNGNSEPVTVRAQQGQQVSILFTASMRDQVQIEGYDINTYLDFQRESTVQFAANQTGEFPITLVKTKKRVGTLIIK